MTSITLNKTFLYIILIFLGALFIRLFLLNVIPVGFHGDEVNIAYNAWSLKETGKDINGNFLPIVINQWGDYRAAGYYYFTALSFFIFGLSDWAVRFPAAFFGSLSVILIWLIADKLYNRNFAWTSAIMLAIFPWHILISRSTSESVVSLFFVLLGIFLGNKALQSTRSIILIFLSFLSFFLSFITYHAARYSVPIFLLGLCLFLTNHYDLKKRILIISFVIFTCITSYALYITSGSVRANQTSIFTFPETKYVLEESIREDGIQNPLYTRIWHNKLISYSTQALNNGLQHLSPSFLLFDNFLPNRYRAGHVTLMPLWMFCLFVVGLSVVVNDVFTKKYLQSLVLLWALTASLVPTAFTFEDIPNVQRSSLFIPIAVVLVAIGFHKSIQLIKGKYKLLFLILATIIVLFSAGQFAHEYFKHSFTHKTLFRNSGEKELVTYLNTVSDTNETAIVTASADNNEIYYYWYLRKSPKLVQSLPVNSRLKTLFPHLSFMEVDCFLTKDNEVAIHDQLYVSLGDCKDVPGTKLEKIIYRSDGTAAFKSFRFLKNLEI